MRRQEERMRRRQREFMTDSCGRETIVNRIVKYNRDEVGLKTLKRITKGKRITVTQGRKETRDERMKNQKGKREKKRTWEAGG